MFIRVNKKNPFGRDYSDRIKNNITFNKHYGQSMELDSQVMVGAQKLYFTVYTIIQILMVSEKSDWLLVLIWEYKIASDR